MTEFPEKLYPSGKKKSKNEQRTKQQTLINIQINLTMRDFFFLLSVNQGKYLYICLSYLKCQKLIVSYLFYLNCTDSKCLNSLLDFSMTEDIGDSLFQKSLRVCYRVMI